MAGKFLLLALLFFWGGKQVAFVDLCLPPKTPEPEGQITSIRGGGIYDGGATAHPAAGTPPISVKLTQIITTKDGPFLRDTVEAVITNTAKSPISVPIGDDPVPLLGSTERGRWSFVFHVTIADEKNPRHIGAAVSAANSDHPESSVLLQPGDTVLFWLPAGTWMPKASGADPQAAIPEVSVSVWLSRKVVDNGRDFTDVVGEPVNSQNTLPLPDAIQAGGVR